MAQAIAARRSRYLFSVDDLKERLRDNGYTIYSSLVKDYNINIVGVRYWDSRVNYFDDRLHVFWDSPSYLSGSVTHHWFWPITTLPGTPYLRTLLNPKGTAIVVPGQYKEAYALGEFRGYTALRQVAPISVYRDMNRNSSIDFDPKSIEKGNFGIHIHKAGFFSQYVNTNSAGCQVFQKSTDYDTFISICEAARNLWGNSFTYTLIDA